jgi:hypothetical protein
MRHSLTHAPFSDTFAPRAISERLRMAAESPDGALVAMCAAFGALFVLMVVCAGPRGKSTRGFVVGHMPLMSFAAEYESHTCGRGSCGT